MDLAWLANSPLLTVAANLTGVTGFGLAIFFYLRGKERFALSYTIIEQLLIQADTKRPFDMNVPLSWKGREVSRLTRSFIMVRNSGNKLIEPSDIVGIPSIQVPESSAIIDADIVFMDDPGTQAMIEKTEGRTRAIRLEFLRPYDAFIFKIDHTGAPDELFVEMKTKAGGPIKKMNLSSVSLKLAAAFFLGATLLSCIIFSTAPTALAGNTGGTFYLAVGVVSFLFGILALIVYIVLFITYLAFGEYLAKRNIATRRAERVFDLIRTNSEEALH